MPINSFLYPGAKVTLGYEVANSLRFNDGSSDYLTRTFGSSATSDKIGTYSSWIKRSTLGEKDLFSAPGGGNRGFIRFEGDDQLRTRTLATANEVKTSMKFRDLSAWYHIVIAYDTTQSTASNRVKIYINGNQQTDLSATTYPSQNSSIYWGQNGIQTEIGYDIFDGGSGYYDGYTAEVVWIDGQALDPTSFGAFNPVTNIWEPIAYTGTYGNNGFRLDFADSSALGNDVSGNDNDFTVNNLTSVDQSTDTCSNNFAVLNPLVTLSGGTLSEGNLKYNYGSNGWRSSFSTIGAKKGKWYCEAKFDSGTHLIVGIVDEDGYSRNSGNFLADSTFNYSNGYAYYSNDGSKNATGKDGQATSASYGNSFAAGDIIGIAMDLDNGKLYFSKNGTFQDSGDPTSGSTGTGSAYNITNSTTSNYFFGVSPYNATVSLNTGSPSFSISSGNADANGHGNFEYAVPSGYFALNTKNLSEFG
jgi:hypothetical protein